MKPATTVPAEKLAALIKKLDDDAFPVRDQAAKELKQLGPAAEKALVAASKDKISLETARQIERLLTELDSGGDWRRNLLALKMLEDIPSAAAREFLESLAEGDPESRLTREAKAILQRGEKPKP